MAAIPKEKEVLVNRKYGCCFGTQEKPTVLVMHDTCKPEKMTDAEYNSVRGFECTTADTRSFWDTIKIGMGEAPTGECNAMQKEWLTCMKHVTAVYCDLDFCEADSSVYTKVSSGLSVADKAADSKKLRSSYPWCATKDECAEAAAAK
jgi:hypothetical protein